MVKVFIIDDSMLIRNIIVKILKKDKNIEIIGEVSNPIDAMNKFKEVGLPDVFILDIEMPKMDGLSFLKKIQNEKPIPTIIFSSIVNEGSEKAMDAFEYGASDVILKPQYLNKARLQEFEEEFLEKIKAIAYTKPIHTDYLQNTNNYSLKRKSDKIIAMGSSTGGVQTLEAILSKLEKNHPPILVTQHMPEGFTKSFAKRLNKICKNSEVKEAQNDDEIKESTVYIAPGNLHLEIYSTFRGTYKCALKDYPKVSGHKPSVDVLFKSMSKMVKEKSIAFLLTGMGSDGSNGMRLILNAGGTTFGQDESSSVVYGMPKVAFDQGFVQKQVNINEIITIINEME